jgi:hypothetical protein
VRLDRDENKSCERRKCAHPHPQRKSNCALWRGSACCDENARR